MNLKNILTIRNLSKHKRRFDRGGIYLSYIAILVTGGTFLKVFGWTKWWHFAIGVALVILFRYVSGWIDERFGILRNEQDQYSKQNPTIKEMAEKINEMYENQKPKCPHKSSTFDSNIGRFICDYCGQPT